MPELAFPPMPFELGVLVATLAILNDPIQPPPSTAPQQHDYDGFIIRRYEDRYRFIGSSSFPWRPDNPIYTIEAVEGLLSRFNLMRPADAVTLHLDHWLVDRASTLFYCDPSHNPESQWMILRGGFLICHTEGAWRYAFNI